MAQKGIPGILALKLKGFELDLNLPKGQTLLESVAKHFLDSKGEKEDGSLKQDSFKGRISNLWAKVWNSASL